MKHFFNFRKAKLLLAALLLLVTGGVSPAWADELTVAEGTATNEYLPLHGYYADAIGTASEFIIPGSDLTDMQGKVINQLTFYLYSAANKKYGATFNVYLEEVTGENYDDSSASQLTASKTLVYTGILDADGSTLVIPFDTEFTYNGGNLIIGTEVTTKGSYAQAFFYGIATDNYAGCCNKGSTKRHKFIPKTTFTYSAANPYNKPASISVTDISTSSAVINWTSGSGDDSETGWNLEYKTSDSDTWTEVHGLPASPLTYSLTTLAANTSYDIRVSALYAGGESNWASTTFKTEKASTPALGFTDNFETDKGWELINGTVPNKWVRGTDTNNGGSYSLYVSQDGTTYPASSYGNSSLVYATKLFRFEAGDYTVSYDWKCYGEGTYDFLRVGLAPATVELAASTSYSSLGTGSSLPTGWTMWLDEGSLLGGSAVWSTKSVDITIEEAGNYQVVFAWRNDYSGGNTPAAIDNFKIIGSAPVLELGGDVAGTTLAFGSVAETTNKTIRITNVGKVAMANITLTETADEDNVFAYASLPKTSLDANESMDVEVTFSGSSAKDYTGTFRVAADDCDPIDVTVTATFSNSPAAMALTLDEVAVGASVAFGEVGKQMAKTFTVTNDGDQTLNVTIASNNTTDFTVAPAALNVTGHTSETFTVTFVYDAEALDAEKTATITVTPSNDGLDPVEFTVTGTRIEQWSEDFSDGTLPDGWEITNGTYWKVQDNMLKGSYSYGNYDLITPSLIVEAGQTMTFDYRMTSTYRSLDIQYSKNNGAWANLATISYSGLTLNQWYTYTIEGLDEGSYKFRFGDSNYDLDNFLGFKRNLNDPKMGIYSDEECTVSVATNVTTDLGFATTDQTATYYIKNDGTGTMLLSKGDNPAGFTATLDKTSVAAGEHATLTITMPAADNAGYHSGNIVVTATDLGTFTVAANGVIRDGDKMYLDFSSDNIPATWTANNWSKNGAGYLEQTSYTKYGLETAWLNAEADEELVIEAQNTSPSSYYTFAVNYKKEGDEEWTNLIAEGNIGNTWNLLRATLPTAGKYQLQFIGNYARIRKIYGLTEPSDPVMVVYDNEAVAGNSYDFGNVSDEADAIWTLTVKNEGKATLTGLAAALSGTNAAHYSVEVSAAELAVDASTTITVKQLKNDLGAHSATLTISADGLESKEIALSGYTYDHNKMFVDFESGSFPAGWTTNSWMVATTSGNQHARAGYTASSLITTPLTVAEDETLVFKAKRQYSGTAPTFQIRYTTDGGVTWTDYTDYASQVTSSDFAIITLSGISAGTAIVEIYGRYVDIDDIMGFAPTTAPVLSLAENAETVTNGSTKEFGNLTEAGTATYTLSNTGTANLVSTVATTGAAIAALSSEDDGVTISENTVTLEPGKSATITLTLPYSEPYGEKSGAMTITSDGWVADFTVNYTATTVDPTALYVDFADNTKPEGWYQDGWSFSNGYASAAYVANKQLITQKLTCAGVDDVLSFDVWPYTSSYGSYANSLTVEYSTDRMNWTAFANQPVFDNTERQTIQMSGAPTGEYYVRFTGSYVYMDNISGWHKVTGIEHDLYVSYTNIPTATRMPGASFQATATVHSLRADEAGVYATLFFGDKEIGTAESKGISKDASASFSMTGKAPAEEATYAAKIVVYYSNGEVAFETATTDVEVAHTRTLNITAFTRTDGEDALDADGNNQISPAFSVTVENTGSTVGTPTVKIYQNGNVVATATAAAAVAAGATSEPIALTATNMSAGEGGELAFTAKAFWDAEDLEAKATSASDVIITVNAAAPMFALYQDATPVNNGDDVDFGLVKGTTKTFSYTIKNEGKADLVLKSIVAPAGFTATEVTELNKTIAPTGTLDIDVTLNAEQGIVAGNLVITYKVDESTDNTFTLALRGRSVSAATWTEDFEGGVIPANWNNSNAWTVGEIDDNHYATLTGWDPKSIVTPRLAAKAGDILTFDVLSVGNSFTFAYSTDHVNWSDEVVVNAAGAYSFEAPADGNYYVRFTTRNGRLDNLVGFELNPSSYTLSDASDEAIVAGYYDNVTLNRSFADASWNSVCLPFAVDNVEEFFGAGAFAYAFTGYDADALNFETVTSLVAGQPYVVYVATGFASKELTNVALVAEAGMAEDDVDNVKFRGTFAPIARGGFTADGQAYGLTPEARIAPLGDGASSKGFRAYFDIPAGAPVKALVFDGGIATGVHTVRMTADEAHDIFDLGGRKLSETRKGVNIINGKKVLVK